MLDAHHTSNVTTVIGAFHKDVESGESLQVAAGRAGAPRMTAGSTGKPEASAIKTRVLGAYFDVLSCSKFHQRLRYCKR